MMDAMIGLAVFIGGIVAAFFAGKRKQRAKDATERANVRKATEARIKYAIDFNDDIDWRDSLHERK